MTTKHVPDSTWRKVEKKMVDLVVETKLPLKDSEVLNIVILKGLEQVSAEDVYKARSTKEKRTD